MPVVSIFSGKYCSEEQIAGLLAKQLDCPFISHEVFEDASSKSGLSVNRLGRSITGHPSLLGNLLHEREKSLIHLRAALASRLKTDTLVYSGIAGQLFPKDIRHVLKVCLVADNNFRIQEAEKINGLKATAAQKEIQRSDQDLANLTYSLYRCGPWDSSLYDIKISVSSYPLEKSVEMIRDHALSEPALPDEKSLKMALGYILASQVNLKLLEKGHYYCDVTAYEGEITILINKNVLRLDHLEKELSHIAEKSGWSKNGKDKGWTRLPSSRYLQEI